MLNPNLMRWLSGAWLWLLALAAWSQNLPIQAKSAVLLEARTGQVLYAKNAHLRLPPASLTKMMTALVVMEHAALDDIVTASKRAVETPASSMHLKEGEQVSVRDLLYALLLRSANDAAVALAEHVGGSVEQFARMMNEKAQALGAKNTHFTNPHGLHEPNHYSTAYDLALIARAFMENETLRTIVQQRYHIVQRSLNQEDLWMVNKARFLQMYPYAEGIKTGYTRPAGFCFAGSASKEGRRLIAIVLNSPQREQDTIALMEYGFNAWVPLEYGTVDMVVGHAPVAHGRQANAPVGLAQPAYWVVPASQRHHYQWALTFSPLQAPVAQNQPAGWLVLKQGERIVYRVPLRTLSAVEVRSATYASVWAALVPMGVLGILAWRRHTARQRNRIVLHRRVGRWG
ncbi:MAG: serine-type D-Ala-D-Ala carboxypeptidase [Fimbriimonadales bacterium]|nr:MAG: serine-type D-Ala-D-Ala carboxypeptidase [Fimbriimonadales bacterium]CUU38333.1 D-alanyl-D-alanine carboxypeptidase (penicillin-binding protein 5/6) [Armatimonadetes bacterium DC]